MNLITPADLMACAARELAMRENIYPKWIHAGKISEEKANHELACMHAIRAKLSTDWYVMHGGWKVNREFSTTLARRIMDRVWDDLQLRVGLTLEPSTKVWLDHLIRDETEKMVPWFGTEAKDGRPPEGLAVAEESSPAPTPPAPPPPEEREDELDFEAPDFDDMDDL